MRSAAASEVVLHLGPSADAVGGIASVVAQIQDLDFRGRCDVVVLPDTATTSASESFFAKLERHLRQLMTLRRTVREHRVDIVHIHTCSGFSFFRSLVDVAVARIMRRHVVLHIHGATFDEFYARSSRLVRRLIGRGLRSVNAVVALSGAWRDKLLAMSPRARVCVIENAVQLQPREMHPVPGDDRGSRGCDGPCRFLLLARMDSWKGIDDLLEACARLHAERVSFMLTLAGPAGSAGNATSLPEKIRLLGLSACVEYVGEVRGEAKGHLLGRTDVYVQPSHNEGMPIAVLEAFASGLPVIATRVGAMPEIINSGCEGLLVRPRDPAQLAEAMALLARDSEMRGDMGVAAHRLAESRFSAARLRDDLTRLYDAVALRTWNQAASGESGYGRNQVRTTMIDSVATVRRQTT